MGKFERLDEKPTPAATARAINAVHDCLDDHREESRRRHQALEKKVDDGFALLMHDQRILMTALRIERPLDAPPPASDDAGEPTAPRASRSRMIPRGKSLATMSAWELAWTIAMGTGPILALWSWGGKLGPLVAQFVVALNHAVTGT